MPILKNAKKALRSSQRKSVVNQRNRSRMRTALQQVRLDKTATSIAEAYRRIDRAVKNKLIHRNKAARMKSQIARISAK